MHFWLIAIFYFQDQPSNDIWWIIFLSLLAWKHFADMILFISFTGALEAERKADNTRIPICLQDTWIRVFYFFCIHMFCVVILIFGNDLWASVAIWKFRPTHTTTSVCGLIVNCCYIFMTGIWTWLFIVILVWVVKLVIVFTESLVVPKLNYMILLQ